MPPATASGSATRWGPLWGARSRDWLLSEAQQQPTYDAVLSRVGLQPGQLVLDIGCGAGTFLRAAARRGARAFGLDASEELVALAAADLPDADLRVGEMQDLPYGDDTFDLVTGFNAFFFAQDLVGALREAARVARPGAPVVIQVWGDPVQCRLEAMKEVVRPLMPARPPDAPQAPELWRPGVLEAFAERAGLTPADTFDVRWAYRYPDDDALGRAMVAPAGIAELAGPDREPGVRRAIVRALSDCREGDGSYRIENSFHVLVTRA